MRLGRQTGVCRGLSEKRDSGGVRRRGRAQLAESGQVTKRAKLGRIVAQTPNGQDFGDDATAHSHICRMCGVTGPGAICARLRHIAASRMGRIV